MRIGQVILTYAMPAMVRLQLAATRHHCGPMPTLVWDDGSPARGELAALCEEFDAELDGPTSPVGHHPGCLVGASAGLHWAHARGIDCLLVRVRRYVPLLDWTGPLIAALAGEPPTCGTSVDGLHLRFECWGARPADWVRSGAANRLLDGARTQAQRTHASLYRAALQAAGRPINIYDDARPPYAPLPTVVPSQRMYKPDIPVLWRYYSTAADYAAAGLMLESGAPPNAFRSLAAKM